MRQINPFPIRQSFIKQRSFQSAFNGLNGYSRNVKPVGSWGSRVSRPSREKACLRIVHISNSPAAINDTFNSATELINTNKEAGLGLTNDVFSASSCGWSQRCWDASRVRLCRFIKIYLINRYIVDKFNDLRDKAMFKHCIVEAPVKESSQFIVS